MNKFIEQSALEGKLSAEVLNDALDTGYHAGYVGLDVHKDTIAVAVAWLGRGEAQYLGETHWYGAIRPLRHDCRSLESVGKAML
jgi:hypothetical protein